MVVFFYSLHFHVMVFFSLSFSHFFCLCFVLFFFYGVLPKYWFVPLILTMQPRQDKKQEAARLRRRSAEEMTPRHTGHVSIRKDAPVTIKSLTMPPHPSRHDGELLWLFWFFLYNLHYHHFMLFSLLCTSCFVFTICITIISYCFHFSILIFSLQSNLTII